MGDEWLLARLPAAIDPVGTHGPALPVILQVGDHDLIEDLLVHCRIFHRTEQFDAPVEVARHPVGRRQEYLRFRRRQRLAVAETDDACMLEEAADDALDADILT